MKEKCTPRIEKMTKSVHHTLKNNRKSTSWWVKGDSLVEIYYSEELNSKNSWVGFKMAKVYSLRGIFRIRYSLRRCIPVKSKNIV